MQQNLSVVLVSATKRIGFRSIELVQEPPPNNESGLLFYFAQRTSSVWLVPIHCKVILFLFSHAL